MGDSERGVVSQHGLRTITTARAAWAAVVAALTTATAIALLPNRDAILDSTVLQSFLLLVLGEVGDKTFFMTAMLAAKHGSAIAAASSYSALASITVLSVLVGQGFKYATSHSHLHSAVTQLVLSTSLWQRLSQWPLVAKLQALPFKWTDYLLISTFAWVGISTLSEVMTSSTPTSPLLEQVPQATDAPSSSPLWMLCIKWFWLIFVAELGDRSFFSIFSLSVGNNVWEILLGTLLGQGLCVGLAIVCGDFLSQYVSERVILSMGGGMILFFAALHVVRTLGQPQIAS